MKTKLLVLLCSTFTLVLGAQSKSIETLYNSISTSDDVFKVELGGVFFDLVADTDETQEKKMEGIKTLRILGAEHSSIPGSSIAQLLRGLRQERFETLTEIRSDGDRVQIMMKENKNVVTDFVAVFGGKDGFLMFSVEGEFSIDDLKDLDIDVEGSDKVKKMLEEIPRA